MQDWHTHEAEGDCSLQFPTLPISLLYSGQVLLWHAVNNLLVWGIIIRDLAPYYLSKELVYVYLYLDETDRPIVL